MERPRYILGSNEPVREDGGYDVELREHALADMNGAREKVGGHDGGEIGEEAEPNDGCTVVRTFKRRHAASPAPRSHFATTKILHWHWQYSTS